MLFLLGLNTSIQYLSTHAGFRIPDIPLTFDLNNNCSAD